MDLVRQLEQDGIACPNCNKKLSVTDSRCPNCGCVLSKVALFAIIAILAGVAVTVFLVVYMIGLF
jgi:hypothetical protein